MRLRNRTAVIVGASRGLGKAVAIAMAREGADLVLVARGEDQLRQAAKQVEKEGTKVFYYAADVSKYDNAKLLAEFASKKLGKIDILVNSIAERTNDPKTLHEQDPESIEKMVDTNLKGTMWSCKAFLPDMPQKGGGHIINISSIAAVRFGSGLDYYTATKSGIAGFDESLRREYRTQGIKVTTIFPGRFSTTELDAHPVEVSNQFGNSVVHIKDVVASIIFAASRDGNTMIETIILTPQNVSYM